MNSLLFWKMPGDYSTGRDGRVKLGEHFVPQKEDVKQIYI